jgi:hypothetical protein
MAFVLLHFLRNHPLKQKSGWDFRLAVYTIIISKYFPKSFKRTDTDLPLFFYPNFVLRISSVFCLTIRTQI